MQKSADTSRYMKDGQMYQSSVYVSDHSILHSGAVFLNCAAPTAPKQLLQKIPQLSAVMGLQLRPY